MYYLLQKMYLCESYIQILSRVEGEVVRTHYSTNILIVLLEISDTLSFDLMQRDIQVMHIATGMITTT